MKILFVHNYYQQSGGEDVAFENESALLKQRGHHIHSTVFKNRSFSGLGKLGAGIRALYNVRAARKIKKVIKVFKPDVIHVHNLFFEASPSVLFVAKKYNVPVVLTLHNYRLVCCNALLLRDNKICELCVNKTLPQYGIRYKCYHNSASESALVTAITGTHKLLKTWDKKVTTYIALTEFAKQKFLHSSLGASGEQITVKPNFINDPENGIFPREDFFLFAGRISPEKGIENLLEAFAGTSHPKLMIAGDGPGKEKLQKQYSGNDNITFAGKLNRTDLLDVMKRCKALIVPSLWYEMLPFIIIEAFATGTPVLASNLVSIKEIVTDGVNGSCFDPADISDIRHKVNSFASIDNSPMYANARQTYLDKYHPDQHYRSIMAIYNNAMSRNEASNQ